MTAKEVSEERKTLARAPSLVADGDRVRREADSDPTDYNVQLEANEINQSESYSVRLENAESAEEGLEGAERARDASPPMPQRRQPNS